MTQMAEEINGWMRIRENFQTFNSASTNFDLVISICDKELNERLAAFKEVAAAVETELNKGN
jgi:hypothetical protein